MRLWEYGQVGEWLHSWEVRDFPAVAGAGSANGELCERRDLSAPPLGELSRSDRGGLGEYLPSAIPELLA